MAVELFDLRSSSAALLGLVIRAIAVNDMSSIRRKTQKISRLNAGGHEIKFIFLLYIEL